MDAVVFLPITRPPSFRGILAQEAQKNSKRQAAADILAMSKTLHSFIRLKKFLIFIQSVSIGHPGQIIAYHPVLIFCF